MTALELIEKRMVELWGKRNVSRLAKESGVPRESVSKILSGDRGLGDEVAEKLAPVLRLSVDDLLEPAVEPPNYATVLRRLEGIRDAAGIGREAIAANFRALQVQLDRIETRLPPEAPEARELGQ